MQYRHTHTHTREFVFSLAKEGNSNTCYNMDELREHYANNKIENKPVTKDKYV